MRLCYVRGTMGTGVKNTRDGPTAVVRAMMDVRYHATLCIYVLYEYDSTASRSGKTTRRVKLYRSIYVKCYTQQPKQN